MTYFVLTSVFNHSMWRKSAFILLVFIVLLFKVTLDLHNTNEKFGSFLRSALDVLSQVLELATLNDIGKV